MVMADDDDKLRSLSLGAIASKSGGGNLQKRRRQSLDIELPW